MNNISLNNSQAFHPGLINDLLLRNYLGLKGTTEQDKTSFQQFDQDVVEHPQWLGKYVFITTIDGKTVGCVSFDSRERPLARIGHNCILPEFRGQGLGKKQMEFALNEIRNQGFTKAIVSTCDNEDFIPAQKMYISCGFTETRRFYRDGNPNTKMIEYEIEW